MFHIPELVSLVIDHLHDDLTSLEHCALVARSWVPASQYHIFYCITLTSEATCRALCATTTQSPHIGRYIRDIHIHFASARPSFFSLLDLRIPQLRALSIITRQHTTQLSLIQHLIQLPSLRDIRFYSGTSAICAQLAYLCQHRQTRLRNLMLYSVTRSPAPEDKNFPESGAGSARPLSVASLEIRGEATLVTNMLTHPRGPINLSTLEALAFDSMSIECLPRLLAVCGPHLTVLKLRVFSPSLASHINIDQHTISNLTALVLYGITLESLHAVPILLSQLFESRRTSALRTLRFSATLDHRASSPFSLEPATCELWREIDVALGSLVNLEKVVADGMPQAFDWTAQFESECCPALKRRGILRTLMRAV